ncbi:RICIN domain-containing protein [Streptomyces sp. NPDC001678]|uniref:RICIN domain-containing protein n=1 Tax=Streptomyces sp. NPDC001678 TaxID=3364599 RepID=UPI003686A885
MNRHIARAAKVLAAPALALTFLAPVLAVTATPAAAAATDAYTFTNPNGTLNATGNNDGNQISVTPDGTNYTNWRLIKLGDPGTFNIASASSGKCVYASQPAVQQSCGKDGQQWHFRPVDGKPNAFGIARRDDRSGTEYCMDNRGGLHLWGILAQPNICNGSAAQEWTVPASKAAEARQLALEYYADLCSKKTSTCSWTQKSEGQPEVLPRQPASSVWYNDTSATMKQVFTTIYRSGWSQAYSAGVSTSAGVSGVSVPVQAMISSQLTATTVYSSDETTINGIAVDVPPKNYAWVDFAAVGKKVTGTWTFNTDNQPWTMDATVTVPVINSTAGSTMYIARTSSDPAGSSGSTTSPDVKPQTFATTTTKTFSLPAGAQVTSSNGTVTATDTDGTVATILPTTLKDTDGTTHKVGLTVSGNTVTQTVEGVTGDTITGTMSPPVFSVRAGAAAPAAAKALAKTAAMAQPAASGDKRGRMNCIGDKMGEGATFGLLGAALGQPEAVLGGVFGGLVIGLAQCTR